MRLFLLIIFFFSAAFSYCQKITIHGIVEAANEPVPGANVVLSGTTTGTTTDEYGRFSVSVSANSTVNIRISFVGYQALDTTISTGTVDLNLRILLREETRILDLVEISDSTSYERTQISLTEIKPESIQDFTSPFNDFTSILSSLPGVFSNNELSSEYNVRGGNFDENLVYVNGIPIYKPFLITAGQQEGLSFVNPDLVESVTFSSGGWQPRYGDKLSSVLDVQYRSPTEFGGSATLGLLGEQATLHGIALNQRLKFSTGYRRKDSQYLLNSLETEGQYFPNFIDLQGFATYQLTKKSEMGMLISYARNRYLVIPESRETEFGTLQQALRLSVGFIGRTEQEYDALQGGVFINHAFTENLHGSFVVSGLKTIEREFQDVEAGYRLCDVNNTPGTANFDECVVIRGIGTNFNSSRNVLEAQAANAIGDMTLELKNGDELKWGGMFTYENFDDQVNEFGFLDSSDFVILLEEERFQGKLDLTSFRLQGFLQHTLNRWQNHTLTYGLRLNWWNVNEEVLFSPRVQYAFLPQWRNRWSFKAAVGLYQQPPFYREIRNRQGELNKDVQAQKSLHAILGADYEFTMWARPFKLTTEAYYKYLWDVNPYDIDDVRIRYFATNDAVAFARGFDFRLNGEFIKGTESWFSLGILDTKENIAGDEKGFIRRPSDQTINLAINFEDHIPGDPTLRVNLALFYGSGLPFGPPGQDDLRNIFNGDDYRRVDIGFTKIFNFRRSRSVKTLYLRAEVLNLFGADNAISYLWIQDVNRNFFAVPNSLSARFLNVKARIDF